ncbi:hypothetical protein JCM11641_004195 [Rhodosporidiobolus odoratus]
MPPKRSSASLLPHNNQDCSHSEAPGKVSHRLLSRFYPTVYPLDRLIEIGDQSVDKDDPPALRFLLQHVLVGSLRQHGALPKLKGPSGGGTSVSMSEVIDQVQQRIFAAHAKFMQREKAAGRAAFATPKNILAFGYRLSVDCTRSSSQARSARGPGVVNVFPNTTISSLTSSPAWEALLAWAGPDPLIHLLSDPNIALFAPLPNASYLQVSGTPVADLKPLEELWKIGATQRKRAAHQRARRKRRRAVKTRDDAESIEPAADEESSARTSMVNGDCDMEMPSMPRVTVTAPTSLAKRSLRAFSSAPLLQSPTKQSGCVPALAGASSKLSPTKLGRMPLRATQSMASIAEGAEERPKKRRKLETINPPNAIVFPRHRMYHNRVLGTKRNFPYGLPARHILTRLPTLYPTISLPSKDASCSCAEQARAEAPARHLAKYIFPRQYGMHSPFTQSRSKSSFEVTPDYLDREVEIKKVGSSKTPERLKPALGLLGKLAVLSQRCNYRKLLDRACPSKISHKPLGEEEMSAVLDLVSEPRTQASRANVSVEISHASQILPHGETQADQVVEKKPKLAEFACSFYEVEKYILDVVEQIIPRAFWGSVENSKLIRSSVSAFVQMRRWETTSVHALLQGFAILDCEWLAPPSSSHKQNLHQRPNAADMEKRRELLCEALYWFMDGFVVDLIRTAFYVTDAAMHQNRPLYFRQDDWNALSTPLLDSLRNTVFEKVPATQIIPFQQNRELGFSFVRLLPKETGVRPIINLARRPLKISPNGRRELGQPINKVLQSVFNVLTFEKKRKPRLVGSLVSDPNEIFTKLKSFKMRMLEKTGTGKMPQLYFVKVDVRACYDTIQQDKLLGIVEEVLSEAVYWVQKYSRVTTTGPQVVKQFKRRACTDDDLGLFEDLAESLAGELHNAVFADQVVYERVVRDRLLQLLKEHITTNLVKVGGRLYRQKEGIPQGSVLSSLLCSLFYGDMEKQKLGFLDDPDSVLLRYVDDFLFISTNEPLAGRFLRVMDDGIPEYGCTISAEKRLTNFDITLEDGEVVPPVGDGADFPWCGLAINTRTLEIQFNTQPQADQQIVDQLTISRHRKPGKAFLNAMLRATKIRAHVLYSDTSYNSPSTAYGNVYRAMLVVALKFQAYAQEWGLDPRQKADFLLKTIQQIVSFAYSTLVNRARAKKARLLKVEFTLKQVWVNWLSYHAFHRILSRRATVYSHLLDVLSSELKKPLYAAPRIHLGKVVKAEGTTFADKTNVLRKVRRV